MTATDQPQAVASSHLPEEMFRTAPLRHAGLLSDAAESSYIHSSTATMALYRVIAIGTGVSWLAFMALGSNSSLEYLASFTTPPDSLADGAWWLFTIAALATVVGSLIHRKKVYFWTFLVAGNTYLLAWLVHLGFLVLTGSSPMTEMYLGDYVGLPIAMLMAVLPGKLGVPLAVITIGVAGAINLGTPLGWNTVLEVAHAEILMIPFLVLVQTGRQVSSALDRAASHAHRDAVRVAKLKTLLELETRFLGYVHDRVLTFLDGVWRGVIQPPTTSASAEKLIPTVPSHSTPVELARVLSEMVSRAGEVAPDSQLYVPQSVPPEATLPADVAATLTDALLESLSNAVEHAPRASLSCRFKVELEEGECTGLRLTISDDGPGFNQQLAPRDRAGIRIAVIGRMQATEGCDVSIESEPGKGTVVTLSWSSCGLTAGEITGAKIDVPTVYDLVGVAKVFRPANAILVTAVFIGLSLNNDHSSLLLLSMALVAATVAAWSLIQGAELELPGSYTTVVMVSVPMFFMCAALDFSQPASDWPHVWYPWVLVLLCVYLAIRDRAAQAWTMWAVCLVIAQLLASSGWGPSEVDAVSVATMSMVLLPATLIPRMVKLTTRGLPLAMATEASTATAVQLVATQRSFLGDSAAWVTSQVRKALNPRFDVEVRRLNAHLLELRLRDSIRSPLFDSPDVTRSVWDARGRGVKIKLLDDRSSLSDQAYTVSEDPRLERIQQALVDVLAKKNVESVTARIFPEGRSLYATAVVTDAEGTWRIEIV